MVFLSLTRTVKFAFQNFWRNIWLSVVTVVILVLTLLFVSLLSGLNLLADQAITAVQEKVDIEVFFMSDASDEQLLSVQKTIESYPEVKEVAYVSEDQALDNFKKEHADDEQILSSLDELEENPLPPSLIIQAHELSQYDAIIARLDTADFTSLIAQQDFQDNALIIQKISSLSNRLTQVGIAVSVVFALISFLVVFNTLRIAIYSQREQVGIMRLVGAPNWIIRTPFVWESLLYAFVASGLTMAVLYPVAVFSSPYVDAFFSGYDFHFLLFFQTNIFRIFFLQLGVAIFLSVFTSMVAITRYLKV